MIHYLKASSIPTISEGMGKLITNKTKSYSNFIEDLDIITEIVSCFKNTYESYKLVEKSSETMFMDDDLAYQDIICYSINILLELLNLSSGKN